jgi:hypothetical protein
MVYNPTRAADAATMFAILAAAQASSGDHERAKRTLDDLVRLASDFDLDRMVKMARAGSPLYADKLEAAFGAAGILG